LLRIQFANIYIIIVISIYHFYTISMLIINKKHDFLDAIHVAKIVKFKLMANGQIWCWRSETYPKCSNNITFDNESHQKCFGDLFHNSWIFNDVGDIDGQTLNWWLQKTGCFFSLKLSTNKVHILGYHLQYILGPAGAIFIKKF
jgi:hypothetical protein